MLLRHLKIQIHILRRRKTVHINDTSHSFFILPANNKETETTIDIFLLRNYLVACFFISLISSLANCRESIRYFPQLSRHINLNT